ncbi:hypothetical protein EHQ27_14410 [Leptospira wolffii]|uniref:Uncharacterized protein n=1 Tax=Leptospira wolffii TaxID=409998 RepID=A0A2M9ZFX2_9LEPT|nr:hypothetical protein [Leptospira wolffii]PJZ67339.1 hypothetical protein CH371_04685 [Leptospira wolffii]TGK62334.1 hypothetical protein EHQ32_05790 [Leptospira wolffii]TGK68149.1 hypothetical protein EHQ27_14410 [Leptospira wolffii]TGK74282.1 hypothetical protein EHQ35_07985 [Leptospira wolffii]TGL32143.1 hypothetical protein EHQ57_04690 [Leptospira wolffii]
MFLTLLEPVPKRSSRLLRYLIRLVRKDVRTILVLPKQALSMEDGLKLGKLLSKIPNDESAPMLCFAESFAQAVAFCKELKETRFGTSSRVLPIFIDVSRLSDSSPDKDLGERFEGLGEIWERNFPLTCFLEIGRSSSRLEEASVRTSLFRISSLVLEARDSGWRRLKEVSEEYPRGEWTGELLSNFLLE